MKQDLITELMLKALIMDRRNFVEALVVNGFSMQKFLTVSMLRPFSKSWKNWNSKNRKDWAREQIALSLWAWTSLHYQQTALRKQQP